MLDQLPLSLRERVVALSDKPAAPGRFVLYWMHHALRVDENPALDVARLLAVQCGLPLLVCQGLGGAHRFNNDRHHFFAMQCARDVAQDLDELGIAYRFHLDARHGRVMALAVDAAVVVVEQMPVPPFPAWQRALADRVAAPVLTVDARCIVPMPTVGRRYERAFAFRKATADAYAARVGQPYVSIDAQPPVAQEDLADGALRIAALTDDACLDLIATCDIDHSVAPVWHTRGGARAAQTRWTQFGADGLKTYHRLRNDAAVAPPQGVSRLSAYLHYGCIAATQIARECCDPGGDGAAKFLDELFVWREVAHNYCYHTAQLETLDALPAWAQATLREHADDSRRQVFSWDQLAHARTGVPLWDTAQRSLMIHGELHNNVRMTWAKQLVHWTRSPQDALRMLLDLNHRYALDGGDPNSYGGLLWALGLFDRPFKPAVPVLGTVRPRSVSAHARRLDLPGWQSRINQPSGRRLHVGIVGAGVAGMAAARTLVDHGHNVLVFDKARGPGGRMSTRRADGGGFDHGAQYFTVRGDAFARRVAAWREDGLVAPWPQRLVAIDEHGARTAVSGDARYVFVPGMNALCKHLALGVELAPGMEVVRVEPDESGWRLFTQDNMIGEFDQLVLTAPSPQATCILERSAIDVQLTTEFVPCHAAMLTLPAGHFEFDAAFVADDDIAWVAHDDSKPGRVVAGGLSHWVVHATEAFSRRHLDTSREDIAAALSVALRRVCRELPAPLDAVGHRWRYARSASSQYASPAALCVADGLWLAGDGLCPASRVESAWQSGIAAAARVMASVR